MAQEFKRWYDHDPLLLKVINILKDYQNELKEQAELFLSSKDPVISKTVELLRVVPPSVQKQVAQSFIDALKSNGIEIKE